MRLTIPFDLSSFVKTLPLRAHLGVFTVDAFICAGLDDWKHPTIREIAVVRDGEHASTGLVFVSRHPFPQVARIIAAKWGQDGVRHNPARFFAIVAENDIPMQIVAAGV